MEFTKRNKIVAGTIIAIILAGIIAAISIIWISSSCCTLSDKEPPVVDFDRLKNIPDPSDYKSMATFDGYLDYVNGTDDERYLPLKLESINFKRLTKKTASLVLATDCARIDLSIIIDESSLTVFTIQVDSKIAKKGEYSCIVNQPSSMVTRKGYHIRLANTHWYPCDTTPSSLGMMLVVNKLEFEILGDPKSIEAGKYSSQVGN